MTYAVWQQEGSPRRRSVEEEQAAITSACERTRLAVVTANMGLFERVRDCFATDDIECDRFAPDSALGAPLKHTDYGAALYDGGARIDPKHPVFNWRACRSSGGRRPVVVLVRFHERAEIRAAFEAGASDIVICPFDAQELFIRTQRVLHRVRFAQSSTQRLERAGYLLDKTTQSASYAGRQVRLTRYEFLMAWLLFSNIGSCVARKQIAHAVWGCSDEIVRRTVEQHAYQLRVKLRLDEASSVYLRTVYGRGYQLDPVST